MKCFAILQFELFLFFWEFRKSQCLPFNFER